jgi:hypothetical protein
MTMAMTIRRNWLVVANAERARVLEDGDRPGEYLRVADLVHPQSRQKGVDLAAAHGGARPGHVEGTGHGLGSTTYLLRTVASDYTTLRDDELARRLASSGA